jgi:hypothetical protein
LRGFAAQNTPYLGGTLWLVPSLPDGPTLAIDAAGNASWSPAIDAAWIGQTLHFQFSYRDLGQTDGTNAALSNAGWAVVTPP